MIKCILYSHITFTVFPACRDVTFGFDQDKEGRVKPLKNPKAVVTGDCKTRMFTHMGLGI